MYIGGGILGTILVILLILWLLGMVGSHRRHQTIHRLNVSGCAASEQKYGLGWLQVCAL